jgi:signal transduction histidine kinase/ActR/RegA family two-component response regulator
LFILPLLTVAYMLCGRLGLWLAVPPGYASPIFPPAGIAIAAMLIWGPATLPWVFLGSFLLNVWVGAGLGQAASLVAAALGISAASTLQAALGGGVLRRAIGYPAALDTGRHVARFLLLAPLCCLVSATLSLAWLTALGAVDRSGFAANWVSWWIGDTLGVLVLLPLMFVLAGEPRSLWRGRAVPVAMPMLSFFALFVAIFVCVAEWEQDAALLDFRLLSREVVDKVHSALDEQDVFLDQLNRSFTGSQPLSRAGFHHLVGGLLRRFPTIQAVKWAPRIGAAERAAFEAAQQGEMPGFAIRAIGGGQAGEREKARPYYYPVTYVEPLVGNRAAVGLDLESDRARRTAIEEAVTSDRVTATAPLRLAEGDAEEPSILLLLPVRGGPDGAGVLLVALRIGTLMKGLLAPVKAMVAVELVDLDAGRPLYGAIESRRLTAASYDATFGFGGRRYDLETEPTAAYLARQRSWQSWGVLVAGVLSTGLLGALLMLGTGYARRIENVVEARTRDLAAVNRRLQIEIDERRQAEAALRQAQRLEAIGQLTGGIAHDFNNLLTVVRGNAELLRDAATAETVRRRAAAIARAVERGERLTRQLLAFSRPQTPPQGPVDLRQRAQEIGDMLAQTVRNDIGVEITMPPELWPVAIDPAEFDLALLNIAVNARDAMPKSGRFRVAARNARLGTTAMNAGLVGDFVVVTLSDTGGGMTPDVQARAFEPYFTTKAAGVGSGLGLSQVYGFAKESGGAATIDSVLGEGTTVTLYLPRATAARAPPSTDAGADPAPHPAALRILLVEDDAEVAEATAELLQDLGYRPVAACDADDALAALDREPEVALVLSDIVMPGRLNGLELARTLRRERPQLAVLLATGYSQYVMAAAKEGFGLVEKPYRRASLAAAIRAAVERAAVERAAAARA